MFIEPTLSLHDNLRENGFTHSRHENTYSHNIYCGNKCIFRGDADSVWEWLYMLDQIR